MAVFNKFNQFVADLANGVHNFSSHTVKMMLTNTAPTAANVVKTDIIEIAAGSGYTAGGNACTLVSSTQTGGLYKLILNSPSTWLASGGSIGPFRYAVAYNSSVVNGNLIGYWDYGSSLTLSSGDSFTATLDGVNGMIQLQ